MCAGLLLTTAIALGCGADDDDHDRGARAAGQTQDAGTLRPDGTVPWLAERAREQDLVAPDPNRHRPSPDDAMAVEPCTAGQLAGGLGRWSRKLQRDDLGKVLADDGLLGYVRVRNTASAACRFRGAVPARLLVGGRPLEIATAHGVSDEARARAIAIAPGEAAELRLDWSSPFCGRARGRQVIELTLPERGGRLTAPVRRAAFPPCFARETEPARRSVLAAGVFEYPRVTTPLNSPLHGLRVRVIAPAPGRAVAAGRVLTYHVVLANPTRAAIALRPCPAYLQSRYSTATAGRDDAVNDAQLYRLNCRPVRAIAAGGRRRFEMKVRVPAGVAPGRRLSVAWGLRARGLAGGGRTEGGFTVTIS